MIFWSGSLGLLEKSMMHLDGMIDEYLLMFHLSMQETNWIHWDFTITNVPYCFTTWVKK